MDRDRQITFQMIPQVEHKAESIKVVQILREFNSDYERAIVKAAIH
jgi:hypothetical protein